MTSVNVPVIRVEEPVFGKPVNIYGDVSIPMDGTSQVVMASDPFYLSGDMWVVQWWEGYGQPSTVDVWVCESTGIDTSGDAFSVANIYTQVEFDELVSRLREGQWKWLLGAMGHDTEEYDTGVE